MDEWYKDLPGCILHYSPFAVHVNVHNIELHFHNVCGKKYQPDITGHVPARFTRSSEVGDGPVVE